MDETTEKPVDAAYQVRVSPDTLSATLTVTPPERGGAEPNAAAAMAALKKAEVIFGIDEAALANALGESLGRPVEVAHGKPPQPGVNGWMEPLVVCDRQRHVVTDEHAQMDLRDQGAVPSVAVGDPLMRRHAPVAGCAGQGATGKTLPVAQAKNADFAVSIKGAEVDLADPDLLRATTAGKPILLHNGIAVEPLLQVDVVDLASGNIEFIGSVEICGDIHSGLHVKVGGDISVGGQVHGGVTVAIGRKSRFVADDTGSGVFVMSNDDLIYGDLAAYGGGTNPI